MSESKKNVNETAEEVKETVKEEAKEIKKGFMAKIKETVKKADWKKIGKKVLIGTVIAGGTALVVYLVKNSSDANGHMIAVDTINTETGEVLASKMVTEAELAAEAVTQ